MPGTCYPLEVRSQLPAAFARMNELAGNLFYSWDRRVRGLFFRIDPQLWRRCGHNPKVFLRRVAQSRLDALEQDQDFILQYQDVLTAYDAYIEGAGNHCGRGFNGLDLQRDQVAYFCMEYGLHESLQIYSGGLGILAGDYCKAASDLNLPFVAVGLMYRQGYFTQTIGRLGEQEARYHPFDLDDLPVQPVRDDAGNEVRVQVALPGREVAVRIWKLDVGRVHLYLLDTELEENDLRDRGITYQLYGGDRNIRMAQELVLGVGGVRALRALGIAPRVWHINEGHPALLILERCREYVSQGMSFAVALETVAASTVFTTHTAVAAGHDLFAHDLAAEYLHDLAEGLGVTVERLLQMGVSPQGSDMFNMTALALRGSRYQNGVSAVHRGVAACMESYVWPEIAAEESPIKTVSNGVHIPTFLAREWVALFDGRCPEWRQHLNDTEFWRCTVESIPDHRFWSLSQSLKSEMLQEVSRCLEQQYRRNHCSRTRIDAMREALSPENTRPLIIGFARRFATYKRALLIFQDIQRLGRLLQDPERPVVLLFAGKAHPQDQPGQALIRRLHDYASRPPFLDRVFMIEGYDMALARKLVTGVDVWLNTPEYPLEASGTSGQKAAINGVVNLSILDGWWAEGYDGHNGWGVAPHGADLSPELRDRVEAEDLLNLLEHEVIPSYFRIGPGGYSTDWVKRCKRSMYSVLPRFNAERMVAEYVTRLYSPAALRGRQMSQDDGARAVELTHWKQHVLECWPGVGLEWAQLPPKAVSSAVSIQLEVIVRLNGLGSTDVILECLLTPDEPERVDGHVFRFSPAEVQGNGVVFRLQLTPPDNGLFQLQVRMYPCHQLMDHPFELGRMLWL